MALSCVLRLLLSSCGCIVNFFFPFLLFFQGYFCHLINKGVHFVNYPLQRKGEIKFWEAECVKIDAANKKVSCRSNIDNLVGSGEFSLDYDLLVVAVGAQVNTFNTPGVKENCHFLKVTLFVLCRSILFVCL